MALLGVSPSDPTPAIRRQLAFGVGPSGGLSPDRTVLLVGNKTSAGTETVDVISNEPVKDDSDCRARGGSRSEIYAMYRKYIEVDPSAKVYILCPTESVGVNASAPFVIATTASTGNGWAIDIHGETLFYSPAEGDTVDVTGAALALLINGYDDGRLQVSASYDAPTDTLTITAAQKGPRGDLIIGSGANRGIRFRPLGANAQTITKGSLVNGTTEDDWTNAIAEAAQGEYYYHAIAKHATTTVASNDNGIGEYINMIRQQSLPINGKDQVVCVGNVGTPTEAVNVAISSAFNSVFGKLFHQEKSDWTPAMIAAHLCAIVRQNEITHPSANINGWSASDSKIFSVPKPYLKADYPTATEIVTLLNNGVSPIAYQRNRVSLVRHITTRSLGDTGSQDYRAREGHIPSAIHFSWGQFRQGYESIRQPFADNDPSGDKAPPAKTTTPSLIDGMIESRLDTLTSDAPFGIYQGPILAPSALDAMKASLNTTYAGGGYFSTTVDLKAVEHEIKWEALLNEVGQAY